MANTLRQSDYDEQPEEDVDELAQRRAPVDELAAKRLSEAKANGPVSDDQYGDELAAKRAQNLKDQELNTGKSNTDSINNQENSTGFVNKFTGEREKLERQQQSQLKRGRAYIRIGKGKGPLTAIILTLAGGGIGISALLSPGLLLIHMKEMFVDKFNTQLTSMTARSTKLIQSKIAAATEDTTKGAFCSTFNIGCKYSTMTDKTIGKFEDAGIKVNYDDTSITGRAKPTSFEFNGKTIAASDFSGEISSNPEFRAAIQKAYNPKYAGFSDFIWSKVAAKLGISKKAEDLNGTTDEEKLAKVEEDTKNPSTADEATTKPVTEEDTKPGTDEHYTPAEVEEINAKATAATADANKIAVAAEKEATSGVKAAEAVGTDIGDAAGDVANTVSLDGIAQAACTTYGVIQGVGYAAKTVRAVQLVRFAMIFLNVADQIKAGTAKPEDVSYLGKMLTTLAVMKTTTTLSNSGAKTTTKTMGAATDSIGYRFAAFGDKNISSDSLASQFMAGGGLTGDILYITNIINNSLGNAPKTTCKIVQNPFVQGASLIGGIAGFLVPGADIAISAKDIAQGIAIAALQIAASFLPALLQDIVAGVLVDNNTVGAAAGDAFASGASGLMSNLAKSGGNAPLTPTQAVAFSDYSSKIAEQYAETDRLAYSPLDPTNSNTFMGRVVAQIIPYAYKMSSLSGILSSIASISIGSFASALSSQTTRAADTSDFTTCQDFDYNNLDGKSGPTANNRLAADPFCNVMYGIPSTALNSDPVDVANTLVDQGQIDANTGEPLPNTAYSTFITNCIDRNRPLGDSGQSFNDDNGTGCIFSDTNSNYYVHYIDQRVEAGMDQ
jgi:hypothetical protein